MADPVYYAGIDPRADRDGRFADHRCPHGVVAARPGGASIWPCPDCRTSDCRTCVPHRDKKRDKRGYCQAHR